MTHTTLPGTDARPSTPAAAATTYAVAGVTCLAVAIYQIVTPAADEVTFSSFGDWFREVSFVAFLAANIAGLALAHRSGLVPTVGRWLVTTGYSLILVGVVIGMALRDDPSWFMALGGPGLLLSTVGWAVIGFLAWRRTLLPGHLAALAGVGGVLAIVGSAAGLTILLGAFWAGLAARRS